MGRKITGMMLTRNNQRTVRQAISSMKGLVDEMIIVDDNSTDDTIGQILKVFPDARIFVRKLNFDFATQRNFGLTKAKNEWVLFIDSDEIITPRLRDEIVLTLENPKYDCYLSRRDNQYFDKFVKKDSGRPILLKKKLTFKGRVHENVTTKSIGMLKQPLLHLAWKDAEDWIADLNTYSTRNAKKWYDEKRKYSMLHIALIGTAMPIYTFFRMYLGEMRFAKGIVGLLYCLGCSAEWTFSALKYYEMAKLKRTY